MHERHVKCGEIPCTDGLADQAQDVSGVRGCHATAQAFAFAGEADEDDSAVGLVVVALDEVCVHEPCDESVARAVGAVQIIEPGAVNWMTAGSGITHTERSHPEDTESTRRMHGIQTWVALPSDAEEVLPSFEHAAANEIPTDNLGASTVRVAVGSGWDLDSPVTGSSPLVLAEISLNPTAPLPIATDHSELAVIALDGDVRANDEAITSGQLAVLRTDVATTLTGSGAAIVLGGEPVGKRHIWWNFVNSDPDRIEQAKADWTAQRLPTVPNDHEPFVPLPA